MKRKFFEPDNKDNEKDNENENQNENKQKDELRRKQVNFGLSYMIVAFIGMWLFQQFILGPLMIRNVEIPYSEFKTKLSAGEVIEVTIADDQITGTMKNLEDPEGKDVPFSTIPVPNGDPNLIEELDAQGVKYTNSKPSSPMGTFLLAYLFPMILIGAIWYFAYKKMAKGGGGLGGGMMGVGKSKANAVKPEDIEVTYEDVGGADEAIEELQEIIQFLKSPEKFSGLGGRIPKGVLLVGPPGTGKTLLAKATAGEANVAFFETSGSEFVEMFVGVGAARVRDLFEQARKSAPAIIFIDEIDAIGQSRGGVMRYGGNDEREQTLNQLLTEIDGFSTETNKPVIIMAATNRPEILDPALLRAGRFDRQVEVSAPDLIGRQQILKIHSRNVKLAPDFDLERAARMTPGFTGADLANVINEAALLAARRNGDSVTMKDFEAAIERVIAGPEKKSRIMNEQERTAVAYHESGHALVAELMPNADPVAKVSIVPRGRGALGYTMQMPLEDRYLMTREELMDRIAVMLGGRAAEKVVFNEISTGASDDIKRATDLARRMITEFGMSDRLGSVRWASDNYQYLDLGGSSTNASPETLKMIDEEVQGIIAAQYQRAQDLLTENRPALEKLTRMLLETETVDGTMVKQALEDSMVKEPVAG